MPQNTYSAVRNELRTSLLPLYDAGESTAIAREVLFFVTGIGYSQSLSNNEILGDAQLSRIDAIKAHLLEGMPVQYAIAQVFFMGREFEVDESVLIPRPETEELVSWILEDYDNNKPFSVLDVGTGSGCIPVSLQSERKNASVSALDISLQALEIAKRNALRHNAAVAFSETDFLDVSERNTLGHFDVIVSNPPYIPALEAQEMDANVLNWEPHTALFVPDAEPLIFYQAIAAFGLSHLLPGGAIYCEIHKDFGRQTIELFRNAGYSTISLKKDLSGHDRIIRATLK